MTDQVFRQTLLVKFLTKECKMKKEYANRLKNQALRRESARVIGRPKIRKIVSGKPVSYWDK